ncbi:MAG: N-acetylneuraminate synthase family protein, partial [Phycisphaerales bacterium]|nr:N-acetylneuraminate synthase family protein [Phycisphaerales bacterium]
MSTLGIILARAGSKGLPDKCVRGLLGRAVIEYTFDHALASKLLNAIVFSTDSAPAKAIARARGIEVIDRPAELATDRATVDAVARHAVEEWERRGAYDGPLTLPSPPMGEREILRCAQDDTRCAQDDTRCAQDDTRCAQDDSLRIRVDAVVLLYGNIPVRAEGLIDRAIEHLQRTGADSVRSVAPVTKQHPDWVHHLDGDRMAQFRANSIYRRQDLEPLYYHDGAVAVVTRAALFEALTTPEDHQSFLGRDRRAIVCHPEDAVDIDGPVDLCLAEAILRSRARTRIADCRLPIANRSLSIVDCRLSIGGQRIGTGERVFIVAEAGVNHNGDVETALRMVDAAAAAGADAVKFQMFRAADLATATAPMAAYQRASMAINQLAATRATSENPLTLPSLPMGERGIKAQSKLESQREMLSRLELSVAEFARIKWRCDERGILFLATP